jgi:reductive dehalogenase
MLRGSTLKEISLERWEQKYIGGPINRFDQKNTMFNRAQWDPEIMNLMKDWSIISDNPKDKPGYTLDSIALRKGSSAGTHMRLLETQPVLDRTTIDVSNSEMTTLMVKKAARWFGADLVGICKIDGRWLYDLPAKDNHLPQEMQESQYAVVMAFEMDYEMISYYNTNISESAVSIGYSRMAITNAHLATFIRDLGFMAIQCGNDTALSIPMAMQAGLGDLGRNGLLITPEFGPRVRLSKIITDLPLITDKPIDFGVTEFCNVCKKCAHKCPSRSIMTGERTAEANNKSNSVGEIKWPVNTESCRTYWARRKMPCSVCIATCPYNKPYTPFHRTTRWLTDHARWADPVYIRMDELFGYGKPKNPQNFWRKWQPLNGYAGNSRNKEK